MNESPAVKAAAATTVLAVSGLLLASHPALRMALSKALPIGKTALPEAEGELAAATKMFMIDPGSVADAADHSQLAAFTGSTRSAVAMRPLAEASTASAKPASAQNLDGLLNTPFSDQPWITGTFDNNGVWKPLRQYANMPPETQMHIDRLYDNNPSLLNAAQIDHFVSLVAPVLQSFEPVTLAPRPTEARYALALMSGQSQPEVSRELATLAQKRAGLIIEKLNEFDSGNSSLDNLSPPMRSKVFDPEKESKHSALFWDMFNGVLGQRQSDLLGLPHDASEQALRQLEKLPENVTVAEWAARLRHEQRHNGQVFDIARVVAARLNLEKGAILEDHHEVLFREKLGEAILPPDCYPSYEYLGRIIKTWLKDNRPITPWDYERADRLTNSMQTRFSPSQAYFDASDRIKFANQELDKLRAGMETEDLIKSLTMHQRGLIFGRESQVPQALLEVLQPGASRVGAREVIGETLSHHVQEQNFLRQNDWANYYGSAHELEAYLEQMRVQEAANRLTRELPVVGAH